MENAASDSETNIDLLEAIEVSNYQEEASAVVEDDGLFDDLNVGMGHCCSNNMEPFFNWLSTLVSISHHQNFSLISHGVCLEIGWRMVLAFRSLVESADRWTAYSMTLPMPAWLIGLSVRLRPLGVDDVTLRSFVRTKTPLLGDPKLTAEMLISDSKVMQESFEFMHRYPVGLDTFPRIGVNSSYLSGDCSLYFPLADDEVPTYRIVYASAPPSAYEMPLMLMNQLSAYSMLSPQEYSPLQRVTVASQVVAPPTIDMMKDLGAIAKPMQLAITSGVISWISKITRFSLSRGARAYGMWGSAGSTSVSMTYNLSRDDYIPLEVTFITSRRIACAPNWADMTYELPDFTVPIGRVEEAAPGMNSVYDFSMAARTRILHNGVEMEAYSVRETGSDDGFIHMKIMCYDLAFVRLLLMVSAAWRRGMNAGSEPFDIGSVGDMHKGYGMPISQWMAENDSAVVYYMDSLALLISAQLDGSPLPSVFERTSGPLKTFISALLIPRLTPSLIARSLASFRALIKPPVVAESSDSHEFLVPIDEDEMSDG